VTEKLKFGTDGIRGEEDQFPFTTHALFTFGRAMTLWGKKRYNATGLTVLFGRDTRASCPRIAHAIMQGMLYQADKSHISLIPIDGDILPSPAILHLMQANKKFHFGIMISASHNAFNDNGIKIFDAQLGKLQEQDETAITTLFESCNGITPLSIKDGYGASTQWPEAKKVYQQGIVKHFKKNFLSKRKIVLDCANGATYEIAPSLFSMLGAEVIAINTSPNGTNINKNCGSLHPERLKAAIEQHNAEIGFAFDGDGDRVIAMGKDGMAKDGDDLLALLLDHDDFSSLDKVVGTTMTNHGFETFLKKKNIALIRVAVGDKHIAAQLETSNLPLGGEPSGHIIIRSYLTSGDGIFVALTILKSVIAHNNWELTTFAKTPQCLINVPVFKKKSLLQAPYATIIEQHEKMLTNGRILVRYSGTEDLLRVMVEDQEPGKAQQIAKRLSQQLQKSLKE